MVRIKRDKSRKIRVSTDERTSEAKCTTGSQADRSLERGLQIVDSKYGRMMQKLADM